MTVNEITLLFSKAIVVLSFIISFVEVFEAKGIHKIINAFNLIFSGTVMIIVF